MTEPRGRAGTVLIALALTNLVAYAMRNALFPAYEDLRNRFALQGQDAKIGLLATAFILPHAIATLPFGWAGDRYDRRRVIVLGVLVASVACAGGALATSTEMLSVALAVVGFGTAAVVPVANSIIGQLYDGPDKASRLVVFNLGLFFGGAAGFVVGHAAGFPAVLVVVAVPGVLMALLVLRLPVPAHPAPQDRVSLPRYLLQLGRLFVVESKRLLRIRTLRWLIASTTAMAFTAGAFQTWLLDFLAREKHMTADAALSVMMVASVGAVAGIVVGGRLADRLRKRVAAGRLWTIAIGMACALPCTAACISIAPGALLYVVGTATFFFFFWYHAPMAASVDDLAPPESTVAAQGLVILTMHLVGTASSSVVVGLVSDHSSLYTAMWVPAGTLAIAAGCMVNATSSFAADHERARSGGTRTSSL